MNELISDYWPIFIFIGMLAYFKLRTYQIKKMIPGVLAKGAVIVDVRSESEFQNGNNPDSINIPLDQIQKRASELDRSKTILLCCASGTRSGVAAKLLKSKGFEVFNGGKWTNSITKD